MNYQQIEKLLINQTIDSFIELELLKQSQNTSNNGFIYTLYTKPKNRIVIGHCYNKNCISDLCTINNYLIGGARMGRKNELNILESTLLELGLNKNKSGYYEFSKNLIRHLNILGWPISNLISNKKIRKSYI